MKHCLVVDDSDVIRRVTKRLLEEMNFTSTEAENGQEALERCRRAMPDFILLDWQMPNMISADFIYLLRKEVGGDSPIVFYCTSENDVEDISRALDAGADDYILKPYDREDLTARFTANGLI
ncbi:MAG: response regulator [Hyphomicrobiaceae bacterium]